MDPEQPTEQKPAPGLIENLDRLLRGQLTQADALRSGSSPLPVAQIALACIALGALYGAMMGLYATTVRGAAGGWQVLSSAVKVPALYLCALLVTFPSLYVFSTLSRSPLRLRQTLGLLVAAIGVNLALLASFGPITAFFTFSTDSYAFMITLNVFFFAVSGAVGLRFLWRVLGGVLDGEPPAAGAAPDAARVAGGSSRAATSVFRVWILIYGAVGAQLGWLLRPFIGSPELPLQLFRQREANFFSGLADALGKLFQ